MRRRLTIVVAVLTCTILLVGCYQPGGLVPEDAHESVLRSYTQAEVDAAVVVEETEIDAPLPDEWEAPDECDKIRFLRFRPADGSTLGPSGLQPVNVENTDAMLVMLPGILEGSNGFEYLGRNLVYTAKTQDGLDLEVWAVERRNNRLEDVSAANYLEEQLLAGMPALEAGRKAIDYYYLGKELNGRTFAGWLKNKDLRCLADFGLQLDTEDVFKVIMTMVPDQETRKQKVFVGGHSMGGLMTSMFAGWDLDGNPATEYDAGYNNCAGLFGLDTSVSSMGGTPVESFLKTMPANVQAIPYEHQTEHLYAVLLNQLRTDPNSERILPFPMLNAEAMGLLEAISMLAYFDPEAECQLVREVPFSKGCQQLLRFLFSRDLNTFVDGVPQITDFRLTNEALLGVVFDDSFVPLGMVQNSMGFLGGGNVVKKSFPVEVLGSIPIVGGITNSMLGKGPYYIPNDAGPSSYKLHRGPLYHWVNFDEVGDEYDPDFKDTTGTTTFTTNINEVADIQDVARVIHRGPTNLTEWYFSTRLIADFMAALFPYGTKYGLNFIHGNDFNAMPKIEFIAGQGVMGSSLGPPPEGTVRVLLEGYNHMDVLTASANTPTRRENGVIAPLIEFVVENLSP